MKEPEAEPKTELDARYGMEGVPATPWSVAREQLETAEVFWLSTVRPDGQPHVTPLIAVWFDDALHFCTGPAERKAKNLTQNPKCVLTTGCSTFDRGLDLVVEGKAVRVTATGKLLRLAAAFETKYGADWHFDVRDDCFHSEDGGPALVFEVAPTTAFGFGKGRFSQTKWSFAGE